MIKPRFRPTSSVRDASHSIRQGVAALLLGTLAAQATATPQTSATLGLYRFDEGTVASTASGADSIIDSSASQAHGTPVGGPAYISAGVSSCYGSNVAAMAFTGGSQEIRIDSMCPLHVPGDVTLEFFLRFSPSGHQSVFWTRPDNSDGNRFNIFVNGNGTFGFDYRSPSGQLHQLVGGLNSGISITPNAWTHLAIVRTGNTYHLYRDGLLAQSATDSSPSLPTSTGWQVSGRGGFALRADVDEIRFSDSALTPDQFLNGCGSGIGNAYCHGTGCPCGNDDPSAGCANSTASGALLAASLSTSITVDDLQLVVSGLPVGQNSIIFAGTNAINTPWGDGKRCVGGNLKRFTVQVAGPSGIITEESNIATSMGVAVGETWAFQGWYRDVNTSCGTGFNSSNALTVTFVP